MKNKKIEHIDNEELQLMENYRKILATPEGFGFFKYFFSETKVFGKTYNGNSYTYFLEGMREVGNRIWKDVIKADPEKAKQLFFEAVVKEE